MSVADHAALAVRAAHARSCLVSLRGGGTTMSVSELAATTGISRPTVEAVLRDLIAHGSVRVDADAAPAGRGRPARRYRLAPDVATVAAVDVGDRSVRCSVADATGTVRSTAIRAVESGRYEVLDVIADVVRAERAPDPHVAPLAAVGLAIPGILDDGGRVRHSLVVPELTDVDVQEELTRRLGCPVHVENDVKLAAYAERHLGPETQNIVFLQLGHRVSVAVVVGGAILQGAHRLAGELGTQRGMRWTATSERGRLRWSTGEDAAALCARAAEGDRAARHEIEVFCAELAPRIASLVLTVDPEFVVVGGGLSRAGAVLIDPLQRAVHTLLTAAPKPDFLPARLTSTGAVAGALGQAFERFSTRILGVPEVPAPWAHWRTDPAFSGPEGPPEEPHHPSPTRKDTP